MSAGGVGVGVGIGVGGSFLLLLLLLLLLLPFPSLNTVILIPFKSTLFSQFVPLYSEEHIHV